MNACLKILILCLLLPVYKTTQAQNPRLVFATHWLPQAQFAGYYVAQDQGFYKEYGIDVEILHPAASVNVLSFLENGTADVISLFLTSAVDAKIKGTDIVNIAQFSENSALMFVARKSSGIRTLQDFSGKKTGIWKSGFDEVPKALFKEKNIETEWIPILSSVNLFLKGGIDAMTVMWYNEYNQIYLNGVNEDEINLFFLKDLGYNIPEDGLYTSLAVLNSKGNELKAFVEASLKGWNYAAIHPDYALEVVLNVMHSAKIATSSVHQKWMLEKVLELQGFISGGDKNTNLSVESWEKCLDILGYSAVGSKRMVFEEFFRSVLNHQ
jgi:NitT/TauT family transport system substrate-binding protein